LLQKAGSTGLIARRIRCVDAQIRDERIFGLAIKWILLDCGSAPAVKNE